MVKVAVSGASGGIGKVIVDAIRALGRDEVVVLSRNAGPGVVAVDYTDVGALRKVLEAHEIHTVISAVTMASEVSAQAQLNLIEAADSAACVRRFLPSEFGGRYTEDNLVVPFNITKIRAAERLEASGLEWTLLSVGLFMDYALHPRVPSAFALNLPMTVDLANKFAVVEAGGDGVGATTHSRDVGRYTAELMGLEKWPRRCYVAGDRISTNEFVRLAEKASGETFEKHPVSLEMLQKGEAPIVPAIKQVLPEAAMAGVRSFAAALLAAQAQGNMDLPPVDGSVDLKSLFPHIKPLTIAEGVDIWYGKQ